jgi:outer membrane protein
MTKLNKIACLLCCFMAVGFAAKAQNAPLLTLQEAVEIALKNNYNIVLAKNNKTIAENNVTIGNAGFLPVITGGVTQNNSRQRIQQTRSDGTVNNRMPTTVALVTAPVLTGQYLTDLPCLPIMISLNR